MLSAKQHNLQPRNLVDWSYFAKVTALFQWNPSNQQFGHSISLCKWNRQRDKIQLLSSFPLKICVQCSNRHVRCVFSELKFMLDSSHVNTLCSQLTYMALQTRNTIIFKYLHDKMTCKIETMRKKFIWFWKSRKETDIGYYSYYYAHRSLLIRIMYTIYHVSHLSSNGKKIKKKGEVTRPIWMATD